MTIVSLLPGGGSMPVAPDAQSLTIAAEQAASNGDFSTAAHFLELAAELQEAGAASMPVELANTLNNLGVVYERLDRAAEAERCYRRAYAVARAVLPAEHPSVALSEKNLRDFCEGRSIPFETAPPRPAEAPTVPSPPAIAAESFSESGSVPPAHTNRQPRSAFVAAGIAVVALGALVLFGIRSFGTSDVPGTPASEPAAPAALEREAPAPAPPEPRQDPPPAHPTPDPVRPEPERAISAAVAPVVVTAAVCSALVTAGAEWQCAPPTGGPGTVFFYTRLAAPAATTVEHRWYRDGRLHHAVSLHVSPNPQRGYRTFSRITIDATRAGTWRAELRSSGGAILHEERFSVVR
jgi:hypothetical protein